MSAIARVVALCILLVPNVGLARSDSPVRVAVLPFEVFSIAPVATAGQEVARALMQHLELQPSLRVADPPHLKEDARDDGSGAPGDDRISEIARRAGADFVVLGSVTYISFEISMDVQVFHAAAPDAPRTLFSEGSHLDAIIEETANKVARVIEAQVARMAPAQEDIPAAALSEAAQPGPVALNDHVDAADRLPAGDAPVKEEPRTAELVDDRSHSEEPPPAAQPARTAPDPPAVAAGRPRAAAPRSDAGQAFSFEQPVNIHADSLVYDNKNNTATFSGNVVARQGDIVIYADRIKGEYNESGGLNRLTASGDVKVVQADRIATGQTVIFYNDEQKIVATGSPRVWQGDNVVQGTRITVFLKDDRYVIEGSSADRVSATIFPEKKE